MKWLDDFFRDCSEIAEECDPHLNKTVAFHDYIGDVEKFDQRINAWRKDTVGLVVYLVTRWEGKILHR